MNPIIECPHPLVYTKLPDWRALEKRLQCPKPGDLIFKGLFHEKRKAYHLQSKSPMIDEPVYGRVRQVYNDEVNFCEQLGSCHISQHEGEPETSISGGPFDTVPKTHLIPVAFLQIPGFPLRSKEGGDTLQSLKLAEMWNFGTERNTRGGGGVYYKVERPVFILARWRDKTPVYEEGCGMSPQLFEQVLKLTQQYYKQNGL